ADELAARSVDAEEVVHVDVGRRLGLGPALGDQRDGAGDAAAAGARPGSAAGPVEPGLQGEHGRVETSRLPEGHVLARAVEGQGARRRPEGYRGLARRRAVVR